MAAWARFGMRLVAGTARETPRRLGTFLRYFKAEMAPPTLADWPKIQRGFGNIKTGFEQQRWRQLTVREAWLNTCVAFEIAAWFSVGVCIGRWNFIGYVIPHTVPHPDD